MAKRSPLAIFLMLGAILAFFIAVAPTILPAWGKKGILAKTNKVGVVEVNGVITDSKTTLNNLKKFRENDAIKAIVMRINSPGGSGGGPLKKYWKTLTKPGKRKKWWLPWRP